MVVVCGDHGPSRTTVFEWVRRFKDRRFNIEDNPRCGRSITATNNETVKDVGSLITELHSLCSRCFNLHCTLY